MADNHRKYAVLLHNIAARAEATLEGTPSAERCEVLVRLYNDYLEKLQGADEDLEMFSPVDYDPDVSPERALNEVMVRAEQLATLLAGDLGGGRRITVELPPIPSMSGLVNREKMEGFAHEMHDWALSVSDRARELSTELSREIPDRISRYIESMERRRGDTARVDVTDDASWRSEILRRVQSGELSVDEALPLLDLDHLEDIEVPDESPEETRDKGDKDPE